MGVRGNYANQNRQNNSKSLVVFTDYNTEILHILPFVDIVPPVIGKYRTSLGSSSPTMLKQNLGSSSPTMLEQNLGSSSPTMLEQNLGSSSPTVSQ